MGFGIRKKLYWVRAKANYLRARVLYLLFHLEAVVLFIKNTDKESMQEILRYFGASIGKNCDIESGLVLHNVYTDFSNLTIGDDCHLGKDVFLDLKAPITIYKNSTISMRTVIVTHLDIGVSGPFGKGYSSSANPVEIGPAAYIGACVTILSGVKVGAGSFVGAGALVLHDVPPRTLVAGVPTKVIKTLDSPADEEGPYYA
jgi:acetyltransferase-like isoleucine patch superfamily enzyme